MFGRFAALFLTAIVLQGTVNADTVDDSRDDLDRGAVEDELPKLHEQLQKFHEARVPVVNQRKTIVVTPMKWSRELIAKPTVPLGEEGFVGRIRLIVSTSDTPLKELEECEILDYISPQLRVGRRPVPVSTLMAETRKLDKWLKRERGRNAITTFTIDHHFKKRAFVTMKVRFRKPKN